METFKNMLKSKINWTAVVVILVSLQDAIANLDITQMTAKGWITFALGVLIIILRTYFTTAVKMVALFLVCSFGMTSCVSMNSAINWAKKNGTVTQTTSSTGAVTTNVKVENFYNPAKIKEKFQKFLVYFDAVKPSILITTVTPDKALPEPTPTFKK